tara:strand:- start:193 stop:531 length:339 start_codon:yes stop_codon:yes gene_type:complete
MKSEIEQNIFFRSIRIFHFAIITIIFSLIIGSIFWIIIKFAIFFAVDVMDYFKGLPTEHYLFLAFVLIFVIYSIEESSVKKDILFLGLFIYTTSAIYLNDWHIVIFEYLKSS